MFSNRSTCRGYSGKVSNELRVPKSFCPTFRAVFIFVTFDVRLVDVVDNESRLCCPWKRFLNWSRNGVAVFWVTHVNDDSPVKIQRYLRLWTT